MDKQRTNAFFLSDDEARRERWRTEQFVKGITQNAHHFCDSCGTRCGLDAWHCSSCKAHFCQRCGKDFSSYQKRAFPQCPACNIKLKLEEKYQILLDKRKIIRYLSTTKLRDIKNKDRLLGKLSFVFSKDRNYISDIWSELELDNPILMSKITAYFQDEVLRRHNELLQTEALKIKCKDENKVDPKPAKQKVDQVLNLKEAKPIDGLESEWKEGKMSPIKQKTYRSKLDES